MAIPMLPRTILVPFASTNPLRDNIPTNGADHSNAFIDYETGFPAITMTPIAAGGLPPRGQSMNGVQYDVTSHLVWLSRMAIYSFNPDIADAGGYPIGAVLRMDDPTIPVVFRSAIDGNTANFNTDPTSIGTLWLMERAVTDYTENFNYIVGCLAMTSDGNAWECVQANGPASNNIQIPEADNEDYWIPFGGGSVVGSYTPEPNTLALRNNTGQTQVNDPIEPLDAVNKQTLDRELSRAGINVSTPEIIAPDENTTMQSLAFQVTGSDIELIAGGTPLGIRTYWRAISDDNLTVLAYGDEEYTTTPTITLPESAVGLGFHVLIRYEDAIEGTSQWSAPRRFVMAASVLASVKITYPVRQSTNVLPNGTTFTVAAGAWTDGSAFTGSQSRLQLYNYSTGELIYDTGFIEYTTSFLVPNDLMTTLTTYWARAQHIAASAPASNPDAILTSPAYGPTNQAATLFTTIAPQAPSVGNLVHTVSSVMLQGTTKTFTISGATSNDSGYIRYRLDNFTGGVACSKYDDIEDGEVIDITAPTISGPTQTAGFSITAYSSFGGTAARVQATTTILAQTEFVFTVSQAWNPTFTAECDVFAGGGGAGGAVGGAGGGCGKARLTITPSSYVITVGARSNGAGNPTSFAGLVTGTGGMAGPSPARAGGTGTTIYYGGIPSMFSTGVTGSGGAGDITNGGDGVLATSSSTPGGAGGGGTTGESGQAFPAGGITIAGGIRGIAGGGGGVGGAGGYGGRGSAVVRVILP